jgi:ribosomal protein L40E
MEKGDNQSEPAMTCCRECKALNPQGVLICVYCDASLPPGASFNPTSLSKFSLTSQMKRRLIYLAVAIVVLVLVTLANQPG